MPGLIRGVARTAVIAGTASAVGGRVHHRQAKRWAEQDAEQYYEQAPPEQAYVQQAPAPPPAAPAQESTLDQLKELAELKNQGILTEEEFETQKAKILGT